MTVMRPQPLTVYASAARTATPSSSTLAAGAARGMHLIINVTAVPGSAPSVVPTIDGWDALSSAWYNLLTGVAITAVGITVLKIYPGIATSPNAAASDILPPQFRVVMTHTGANSVTYSVAAILAG